MDKHDLLSALKNLASELGRTPTRVEFTSLDGVSEYAVTSNFRNYSLLVKAAGLDAYNDRRKRKIDNSIFEVNIEKHLDKYEPRELAEPTGYIPTLAIISDIHWPFCNQRVIDKFYEYLSENKPDLVILNGDAWDMYSHSKFARSVNSFTPREEQNLARKLNEEFWIKAKEASNNSKCYQLLGNHDIRPLKRILETYPEAEDWIEQKLKEMFTFEGVTTIHDHREELEVGDGIVFHGYRSQLGAHMNYTIRSCFNSHTHRGGTVFKRHGNVTLFECNSGYAGDPESKALQYTPQKITEWTPGFSARDKWGPRFIPV